MSSTALEQLRSAFEDIESYERHVVHTLSEKTRNHRERVIQGHQVNNVLNKIVERSTEASLIYEDADNIWKEEQESMTGPKMFTTFYDRLKGIRDFNRKYPDQVVTNEPNMDDCLNPEIQFSGEERFGKYVDLHEFYARFLNLSTFQKWIQQKASEDLSGTKNENSRVDYMTYVRCLHEFHKVEDQMKLNHVDEYMSYLKNLLDYLVSFYRRTQPLVDLDDVFQEASVNFEKQWKDGKIAGWNAPENNNQIEATQSNLYCAPCEKQFASDGVYTSHLAGKKHKKAVLKQQQCSTNAKDGQKFAALTPQCTKESKKSIAWIETKIVKVRELLTEVFDATRAYIELKQTRTHEELQAEIAEEEEGVLADITMEDEEDEEDVPFYNPLNLPLGWDGKPIAYWLYKLHGLGVEYKCEICGNHSYWGRREFDQHFQQWRHAYGMRCLKIPNTKHFHDITLIEDALQLYEKIKDQLETETWQADQEEEFEDSEGNVLNRKTYEDLARQGLL